MGRKQPRRPPLWTIRLRQWPGWLGSDSNRLLDLWPWSCRLCRTIYLDRYWLYRWANTMAQPKWHTCEKFLFRYCRYCRPSKEWFLSLPKSMGIGWETSDGPSFATLELGQSRISQSCHGWRRSDSCSCLLQCPQCGIDCQWGITRSEDLYQEDHSWWPDLPRRGKSGWTLSRVVGPLCTR